jgi:hypothetical protein
MRLSFEPVNDADFCLDRQTPPVIFCRHTSQPVADAGSTGRSPMTALALCSLAFLILLAATLSVALSQRSNPWLTSCGGLVAISFFLTSMLGFILTNELLEVPNPLALAVALVFAGAVVLELAQWRIVKQKAALTDIAFVLAGSCLFLLSRYIMHETGSRIIDQFEVFID